ncbi:zinc ribbon domain-containing protein [Nonomuraea sp. NPDC046570]|uniref:zinc ribbon domain-containing protein n=1 Tax=Nonomuraea sp. NPDC046570 TaxID=3155255 RepID=UPI0033C0EE79
MRRLIVVAAGVAALALVAVRPASAHEHPSGISDLVTPALVRVEAKAQVDITLLDHIGELVHVERSYEVPIGAGTGFVVNPEGGIVTLTRAVKSDQNMINYAANRIFAEHHKVRLPADFARHKLKNDQLNHHLELCYTPEKSTATCIVNVKTDITVYPNLTQPDKQGFKAELVYAGRPDAPAVLRAVGRADGSAGLPTAPLAAKVPDKEGSPVNVAGFLGRPAADVPHKIEIGHLGKGGVGDRGRGFADPEKKVDEPPKLGALIDQGLLGGPVIGDKDGHVIGQLIGGGKDARMIGVREISSALQKAKITPRRGTIDAAFEAALTRFHSKYYTEAVAGFQRVLELYPGHVVAAEHLKTSLAKRGGSEDAGTAKVAPPSGTRIPLWPFIAAAAVILVVALLGAFLLWRRRTPPEPAAEEAARPPYPQAPVVATTPPFDDRASPTVVVRRPPQGLQPVPGTGPQPVLVAPDAPGKEPAVKYCTACGMRLGPVHKFCGYCGHPSET